MGLPSRDDPPALQRSAFSSFLSSALRAAASRPPSTPTVAPTVEMGQPFYTSVDLDRPSTTTLAADDDDPGLSSYTDDAPSLVTATPTSNADQNGIASTAAAENTDLPLLEPGDRGGGDGGLSGGQLAAAIVAPIVFTALLAVLAFLILRRRRSRRQNARDSNSSVSARGTSLLGLREKWGSLKSSASSQKEPEVTSTQNRAYMSGLDTSSRATSHQNSGEHYAAGHQNNEPPPPYNLDALGAPVLPVLARGLSRFNISRPATPQEMSQLQPPRNAHLQPSSPVSPLSPLSPSASALLTPWALGQRPSSSRSARSIASDAYSETASIHCARAARMSVGAPTMVTTRAQLHRSREGSLGDPFDDPNTPVPSLSDDPLATRLDGGQKRGSEE